jgi:hypothetical protein
MAGEERSVRIDRAEVIPIGVPLSRTFYGGTYSLSRRCTLLLRLRTTGGLHGQIYIGDERDHQAEVCGMLRQELFPRVLGLRPSEVTALTVADAITFARGVADCHIA